MPFQCEVLYKGGTRTKVRYLVHNLAKFIRCEKAENSELKKKKSTPVLPWIIDMAFSNSNKGCPIERIIIKEKVQ